MAGGSWFGALANRNFRLFFVGNLTSNVGQGMLPVALSFAVLNRGGSASDVGYVLGAETLPLVLLLLVGGVVADRRSRRGVMMGADALRAAAQSVLAAWMLAGHPPLGTFLVCEALVGVGMAFFTPAMTGLIPEVIPPGLLQQANALNSIANWGGNLVGPAIAGVIVAASGPGWAVAVDAATYVVSVGALGVLRMPARRAADGTSAAAAESFARRLRQGWRAFRERTWLWVVVAQFSVNGLVAFPAFFVVGAIVARDSLGGPVVWGAVLAAQGAGSVLGALVVMRFPVRRPLLVAEAALVFWPVELGVLALRGPAAVAALFGFGAGLAFGVFGPLWDTTMQRELPSEVLSRASAYDWFGSFALLPVGYAVVGLFVGALGTAGTLWLGASIMTAGLGVVRCGPRVTGLRAPAGATPASATEALAEVPDAFTGRP